MDIITTIETFFSYKEEIANLERETPSVDSFDSFDEEKQEEIRAKTKKELNAIFDDYIDWIIETNSNKTIYRVYMRKTFELLFKTEYSVLYIEHALGENHIQGRGDTWKEYESRFRKHLEK